jgi:iron complex outermembrane receptor protein
MITSRRLGLMALGLVMSTGTAFAQMEELVVEAQRREAPVQDVPIAVSAFGTEDISKLQIDSAQDIGDNVPNLQTYTVTANGAAMQVHARGASVQNPGFNTSESPVGLYVDDVYHGRLASANLDLNDIERIEVLRGPQATLYGRNTMAGAIKFYSATPGDDFWARGSVGYGKYETSKVTASVGGPIEEGVLAGSISGLYHKRDKGYQDNGTTGDNPGEFENQAARGKLHFYGSENLDATLSVWAVDVDNDGYNGVPYLPFPPTPGADPGSPISGFYETLSPANVNYGSTDQSGVTLDWTWDFGSVQFRSITGYADIDDAFGFDLAGGGIPNTFFPPPPDFLPGLLVTSDSSMETWSQELQLLGTAMGGNLEWLGGLYYLSEDGNQNYGGLLTGVFDFLETSQSDTTSYAVYGQANWNFTERWSLTGGLRWTKDEKDWDINCAGQSGGTGSCAPAANGTFGISIDDDWDEWTPMASLNYELGDNMLMYLSASKGFQAGGFQTLCFGNLQCAGRVYDPQDVWSYEYGFKSDLFDDRLRVNAAIFYAQYSDIQLTVPRVDTNNNVSFPTENVGDVDVWGIELETLWVPIDNLNIFANIGYIDPDSVSVSGDFGTGTRELPSTPDYTIRAGANYTMDIMWDLDLFFGGDVNYTDEYYNDINSSILIDDYTRFNGFLGVGSSNGRWQLVGEWKNITNEQDNVSGLLVDFATNVRTVLPPLEYMVTLKVNY